MSFKTLKSLLFPSDSTVTQFPTSYQSPTRDSTLLKFIKKSQNTSSDEHNTKITRDRADTVRADDFVSLIESITTFYDLIIPQIL